MFVDWGACVEGGDNGVATLGCLGIVFQNLIRGALYFAGAAAVIIIIFSGIKLITSSGDPQKMQGAKKTLTYGIVGLLVVLFAGFIVLFIGNITNVNSDCLQGGTNGLDGCK